MASWTLACAALLVLGATAATSEETCASGASCPDLESVAPESLQLLQTAMNIAPAMASDKAVRDGDDAEDDESLLEEDEVEGIDPNSDWAQAVISKCGRAGKGCVRKAFAAKEKEDKESADAAATAADTAAATAAAQDAAAATASSPSTQGLATVEFAAGMLKTVTAEFTKKMQGATQTFAASRAQREGQLAARQNTYTEQLAKISALEDWRHTRLVRDVASARAMAGAGGLVEVQPGATSLIQKTILDGEETQSVHVKEMTVSLKAFNENDSFVTKSQVDTVAAEAGKVLQEHDEVIASQLEQDKTALNQKIDKFLAEATAQLDAVIAASAERNHRLDVDVKQIEAGLSGQSMLETKLSSWKGSVVADVLQKQSTSDEEDHKDEEDRTACKEGQTADAYDNCLCPSSTKCSGAGCSECCGGMSWYHKSGTASCQQLPVVQEPVVEQPETATEKYVKDKCKSIGDAITQKIQMLYAADQKMNPMQELHQASSSLDQKMYTMQATFDENYESMVKRLDAIKTQ